MLFRFLMLVVVFALIFQFQPSHATDPGKSKIFQCSDACDNAYTDCLNSQRCDLGTTPATTGRCIVVKNICQDDYMKCKYRC